MDGAQLSQSYRATAKRQITFLPLSTPAVPNTFLFDQSWKDEGLSQLWSHPAVKTVFDIFKGFLMLTCIKK